MWKVSYTQELTLLGGQRGFWECGHWWLLSLLHASMDTCVFGAGQEAATLPSEGGVRITPFNLQEEMEEGHFDADGNYFLNQDAQIRDSWLDNIDWVWLRGWHGWGLEAASAWALLAVCRK